MNRIEWILNKSKTISDMLDAEPVCSLSEINLDYRWHIFWAYKREFGHFFCNSQKQNTTDGLSYHTNSQSHAAQMMENKCVVRHSPGHAELMGRIYMQKEMITKIDDDIWNYRHKKKTFFMALKFSMVGIVVVDKGNSIVCMTASNFFPKRFFSLQKIRIHWQNGAAKN